MPTVATSDASRVASVAPPNLRELLPLLAKLNKEQLGQRFPGWRPAPSPSQR